MMIFDYECQTTFWQDFTIADGFGKSAVQDTYNRALEEWGSNHIYLTELVMILNHKCWQHYEIAQKAASSSIAERSNGLSELYSKLFYEAQDYAYEHLKGDELSYFMRTTD